jgi:hypothetical protein
VIGVDIPTAYDRHKRLAFADAVIENEASSPAWITPITI